jgi:hypothetical protein
MAAAAPEVQMQQLGQRLLGRVLPSMPMLSQKVVGMLMCAGRFHLGCSPF